MGTASVSPSAPSTRADSPRVCICFFGLNRSLSHTLDSIRANVFAPIVQCGLEYQVFAAFMQVDGAFSNPHSGEANVRCESGSETQLGAKRVVLLDQAAFDRSLDLDRIATYGDAWNDGLVNTRNFCRALHSLEQVTALWQDENYSARDLFLYLRPDMIYPDRFDLPRYLDWLRRYGDRFLATPRWALYGGLNDRFGVMGFSAAQIYGRRFSAITEYQTTTRRPLHAETFLKDIADQHRLRYRGCFLPLRATRVRANGVHVDENFDPQHSLPAKALVRMKKNLRRLFAPIA